MSAPRKFVWTISVEVDPVWVADGFDPDADQFKDAILSGMLGYAREDEVTVRIVKTPDRAAVLTEQGYTVVKGPIPFVSADDVGPRQNYIQVPE